MWPLLPESPIWMYILPRLEGLSGSYHGLYYMRDLTQLLSTDRLFSRFVQPHLQMFLAQLQTVMDLFGGS